MNVIATPLPGVLVIEPKVFGDARGFFFESFSEQRYREAGITGPFVQDNVSFSQRGVLRGLHFQWPHPQGKLVSVLQGEVLDVAVDIRLGSTHHGRWHAEVLSSENKRQMWVPEGFAHGFLVLSETALFAYKVTAPYKPEFDAGVRWDDPEIGIEWPTTDVQLSAKDMVLPFLSDLPIERTPAL